KAPSDDAAVAEETAHFHRMGVGGDVEIFRLAIHQQIAHAAATQVRAIAAAMKTVQNFQHIFGNATPRDRMLRSIDDDAFRRRDDDAFWRRDDDAFWRRDDDAFTG